MSSDIVTRVRTQCSDGTITSDAVEIFLEAADEIEDLRTKMSKIKELLQEVLREAYRG